MIPVAGNLLQSLLRITSGKQLPNHQILKVFQEETEHCSVVQKIINVWVFTSFQGLTLPLCLPDRILSLYCDYSRLHSACSPIKRLLPDSTICHLI